MQKLCSSLHEASKMFVSYILGLREPTTLVLAKLQEQMRVDQRRLSEICQVMDAARWVTRNGRNYQFQGLEKFRAASSLLLAELKARKFNVNIKTDNVELTLIMLQNYYNSFRGTNAAMATFINATYLQKRIGDINVVLQHMKIIQSFNNSYELSIQIQEPELEIVYEKTEENTIQPLINRHNLFSQDNESFTPHGLQVIDTLGELGLSAPRKTQYKTQSNLNSQQPLDYFQSQQ
ncbi:Hypothetical_protein [Hexamita inflata]|uniref:Hypothetical_protein n=1 Tax=Hexamita inflata TaxID=28002 RepID=A0ABP1HXI6_9EUKA